MIYFIKATRSGTIKIGVSNDPKRRLDSMQTGSPEPLELLGVLPGGPDEEKRFHKLFAQYRIHGEWFRGDALLLRAVEVLVRKPIEELLDEKNARVWVILGEVKDPDDGQSDRATLVCMFLGQDVVLFPEPNTMLEACRHGEQFSRVQSIVDATERPQSWPIDAERLRDTLVDSGWSAWVYDYDGEWPFVPCRLGTAPLAVVGESKRLKRTVAKLPDWALDSMNGHNKTSPPDTN